MISELISTLQEHRCDACRQAGVDCIVWPHYRSTCQRCAEKHAGCSHGGISGKTRKPLLSSYRSWRAFRQVANPDIYPNLVLMSTKWDSLDACHVPSWFRELFDKLMQENPPAQQRILLDPDTCEAFPRLPPRPPVELDDRPLLPEVAVRTCP